MSAIVGPILEGVDTLFESHRASTGSCAFESRHRSVSGRGDLHGIERSADASARSVTLSHSVSVAFGGGGDGIGDRSPIAGSLSIATAASRS